MIDEAFGYWLAGFIDGEGSFNIRPNNRGYAPSLAIGLRVDDLPLLEDIRRRLQIGQLERAKPVNRGHLACRWTVASKRDCLALIAVLDQFPLRSKKSRDYTIWREAVMEWTRVTHRGPRGHDWSQMVQLKQALEDGRRPDAAELPPRCASQLHLTVD